jgi:hypothetical protein
MTKPAKWVKEGFKVLGFEFRSDIFYKRVTQLSFDHLIKLIKQGGDFKHFIINLPDASISAQSEVLAVLLVSEPNVEWLEMEWAKG